MKTRIFLILTICCLFFDITESAGQADTTQYNITLPYISFKQSNTYTMDALGTGINTSANIVPFFSSQQSMSNTDADGIRTLLNEYLDNNGWGDILRIAMIKYVASSDDNTSNILNIRITMFILRNENNYNRRIVITGIGSDTITVNQSSIMPDTYPSMSGNCMLMRTYTRPGGTYYFEDIAYFDALGYPEQNISVQASPNRRNIVTPIVFDNMKRNAHNFLPYVSTSATFSNDADPLNRQKTYYANMYDTIEANYTFVKKEYEPSILNRVVKEYNVGSVFQGANDKYRLYDYGVNAENEAFILNVNSETFALTVSGYYQSGELYKNTSVNEDGITTVTFTDKNDNAVLQRIIDSAQTNDTYYAYDDSGHQCWAISPEGSVRLVSGVTYPANNQLAKLYCYVYKYDGRGNITERRIPGREPEYMVYDRGGRLVMSQDGNMRQNSQWIYNVYDNHNNIVERNMTQGDKTREELQSMFLDESFNNDYVSVGNSGRIFSPFLFNASSTNYSLERTRYYGGLYFDTYLATSNVKYLKGNDSNMSKCRPSPLLGVPCQVCDEFNVLMDGTNHIKSEYFYGTNADSALIKYYRLPNQAAVSVAQCLISMYPNYFHEILDEAPFVYQGVPWVNPQTLAFAPVDSVCTLDDLETEKIKGLKAYEKVRVLDESNTYVERAFYYDYWGRMIQTVEKNHLGGISRYSVKYDFAGNILAALEQHETEGTISTAIAIKVNTAVVNTKKLTEFAYDHRGRLKSTATTLNDDATAAVSYRYSELGRLEKTVYGDNVVIQTSARNMQGWITEQQATAYKNSHQPITSGGINLFKSALKYYDTRRAVPNYAGNITEWTWQHQNDTTDTYTFAYDRLNRLVDNRHYRGAGAAPVDMFTEQGMSYDRNGNISKIRRYDADGVCEDCDINYHYEGNQLKYCNTEIPMILMPLYAYDDNGNMNRDFKREMDITYNLLDLPYRIIKNDTVKATYKYLADGTKLSIAADTLVESNSGSSRVAAYKTVSYGFDYLGTCVYTRMGDTLNFESTAFAGGRIAKTTGGYDVNYFITDHLGSTRATVNDNGDITAQYNYYPFGKIWESAGTQAPTTRYLFSGKERQTVRDLGYFDFGARMYDGNTGRWFVTDPMAEMYYGISPYAYCANNPVNYIDPDGMQITETADGWTITGDDIDSFWGWLTSVMTSVSNDGGGGGGSGGGITYPIFGGTEHRGSGSGSWLMDAFFGSQMYYGGELEPAVCTAQAPDWMNNTRYQDTYNPNIVYPKETFLEGALRLVTGIDNRIGYDQDGNAYKHVQPVTGMPPLPGLVKGVSVIKTGAKIISSSTKVISNSEKVAKALKLNINSPTTQQIINNLDKTVESFIGLFRQASITSKFPGEFLNMTIKEALKSGNTTVRKLLTDRRFVK